MKQRPPHFRLILLLVSLTLIIGIGIAAIIYFLNRSSNDITIAWQTSTTAFTQQELQDIQNAWKTTLLSPNPNSVAGHTFTIINAQRQGDWAIFSANERIQQETTPIPTEPLFFIAHRQSTGWNVSTPSSPTFCNQLKQLPDTLLDPTDKHYFLGCYQ